jgi:hypothetical protein
MAKNGAKGMAGGGSSPTHTSGQDARMASITTAATSTMEAKDFSHGYAANEGELLNKNFASGKRGK